MTEIKKLDWIANQEYLGRGFLIGRTGEGKDVVAYFVTGRSESSRARRFESDKYEIRTAPTDPEVLKQGNPALLIYPAIQRVDDSLVVSNGAQTSLVVGAVRKLGEMPHPVSALVNALSEPSYIGNIDLASYEPDAPNYTPRISGVIGNGMAAISILKGSSGLQKQFFEFPLVPGQGKFVSTYTGKNVAKGQVIPSFVGEPISMFIPGNTLTEIADGFYSALGPKTGKDYLNPGDDFRVGVAVAYRPSTSLDNFSSVVINRHGDK